MRYGLLFAVLTVFALSVSGVQAAEPEFLKYEDFLQKVQDGKVKSVTVGGWPFSQLQGIYGEGDSETPFFSPRPLEAANDPLLLELLEKYQVSVVKREQPRPGVMELLAMNIQGLLLLVVPSILLVFVIIYVIKINKKLDQVIIH